MSKKITKKALISEIVELDSSVDVEIVGSMSLKQLQYQINLLKKTNAAIKTAEESNSTKPRISRAKSNINEIRSNNLLNYLYNETIVKTLSEDGKYIVIEAIEFCYIMNINVSSDRLRMFYRGMKPIGKDSDNKFIYCNKDNMNDFIGNSHGSFMHNDYSLKQQIGCWLARIGLSVELQIPKYSFQTEDNKGNKIVKQTISKIGSCPLKKAGFENSNVDMKLLISTINATQYNEAVQCYMAKDFNCSDEELQAMTIKLSNSENSEIVGIKKYLWKDHLIAHAILSQNI